jgi:hypothetical protein
VVCGCSKGQSCGKYSAGTKSQSQKIKQRLSLDYQISLGEINGEKLLRNSGFQNIVGVMHLKDPKL